MGVTNHVQKRGEQCDFCIDTLDAVGGTPNEATCSRSSDGSHRKARRAQRVKWLAAICPFECPKMHSLAQPNPIGVGRGLRGLKPPPTLKLALCYRWKISGCQ